MQNNSDAQEIEKAFERIKSSDLFKRSTLLERILRFLIDQSLLGNDVKEQTIGIEVLNDNYDSDQNNSKVRVYVYNLRKKLTQYYKGPGKNESIIFHIEKGQYNLTFKRKDESETKPPIDKFIHLDISKKTIAIVAFIFVTSLSLYFLVNKKETFAWKPFFDNNRKTICIVADHYMVADKQHGGFTTIQNIDNEESLIRFNEGNPDLSIKPGGFTMTTKMAPFGIHYLDYWFHKNNSNFDLQLETETQYADFTKMNVIYIGQSKTMQASKSIFLKNSQVFELKPDGFTFTKGDITKHYIPKIQKVDYKEYAMVSFQKLDNGNYTFFFVSNHDIGVLATIKMFTQPEKMKAFFKNIPNQTSEFNALFEVNGLKRNEMDCELIELEILN